MFRKLLFLIIIFIKIIGEKIGRKIIEFTKMKKIKVADRPGN